MSFVDLHAHSLYSDGTYTPEKLIETAHKMGLKAIALTDHESCEGVAAAAQRAKELDIDFVPGIEMTTSFEGVGMDILGLFIKNPALFTDIQNKSRVVRTAQVLDIIESLKKLGYDLNFDELDDRQKTAPFPGHLALLMCKKGFAPDPKEADKVLNRIYAKDKTYLKKYKSDFQEVVDLIHKAGGIAILAHPYRMRLKDEKSFNIIQKLQNTGIDGIECYHSGQSLEQTGFYLKIAKNLGLKITGGSDFHGDFKPGCFLGKGYSDTPYVPYSVYQDLIK
ncbi:MAG: PHP domain-containing protein [Lactobacillales bacterium]|jgi:predicted metal-dependent phosphoesterase TrpH|nr:PHP domain-containing protein [Lactobacillales bacterium]